METKEIQRVQSLNYLLSLEEGDWVKVEERGEMMVLRNYPSRRLELISEAGGNGIRHVDISYNQIEQAQKGLLVLNRGEVRTYFRKNRWIYRMLKSMLGANQNGRK